MTRLLSAMVLLACLSLSAGAASLGLYFDQTTWETELDAGGTVEAWLVLRSVEGGQVVSAWECALESTGDVIPPMVWELLGQGPYNFATPPQFAVGLQVPFFADPDLALARVEIVQSGSSPLDLRIQPFEIPSVIDENGYRVLQPVVARGQVGEILENVNPAGGSSWRPEARLNADEPALPAVVSLTGSLDFGQVPYGSETIRFVSLRNEGPATIYGLLQAAGEDYSVRVGSGAYATDGCWVALPPQTDVDIAVRLAPESAGLRYGALLLDDGGALGAWAMTGGTMSQRADLIPRELDFGVVAPLEAVERSITLRNLTASAQEFTPGPLPIPFHWQTDPGTEPLAPGESRTLTVVMSGDELPGLQFMNVDLGPLLPPLVGHGFAALDAECAIVGTDGAGGDFGAVVVGQTVTRTLEFHNFGHWELTGTVALQGDTDVFGLEAGGGPVTLPPGGVHTVSVRCAPMEAGPCSALLTGPGECGELLLTCDAEAPIQLCEVVPEVVDFGVILVGQPALQRVWLFNTGNQPLEGAPTLIGDPAFVLDDDAPYALAPGDSTRFDIFFTPAVVGEVTASLDLGHDICGPVPVVGEGRAPSVDCQVPELVDFGSVGVGIATVMPVEVGNSGELPLAIDPTVTGDFVLRSVSTDQIPPAGTATILVECRATAEGPVSGVLDPGSPDCPPVNLVGEASFTQSPGECSLRPGSLSYPDTPVMQEAVDQVAIINGFDSETAFVPVLSMGLHYQIPDDEPVVVPAREARWIDVVFRPLVTGYCTDHIGLQDQSCGSTSLYGHGLDSGCAVDPVLCVFPELVFGAPLTAEIEITNTDNYVITVAPVLDDPIFSVTTAPFDLQPQTSVVLPVQALAPAPGHYEAVMSLGAEVCADVHLRLDALEAGLSCVVTPTSIVADDGYVDIERQFLVTVVNNAAEPLALSPTILPDDAGFWLDSYPAQIAPGDAGPVVIGFLAHAEGEYTAVLNLGDEACQDVTMSVLVQDLPPGSCSVSPSSVSLPEMPAGVGMITDYTITNHGDDSMPVVLENLDGHVRWQYPGTFTIPPGGTRTGRVRLFAPEPGAFTYDVSVGPSDCGIHVEGFGTSPVYPCELDPYVVDFGTVLVGQSRVEHLALRNIGETTLHLDLEDEVGPYRIWGGGLGTVLPLHVIRPSISFIPTEPGDYFLPIGTGVDGCGPILARGTAVSSASGLVAVDPELDFGVLDIGAEASLEARVVNRGQEAAVFTASVQGEGFCLESGAEPQRLAPGESISLLVTCRGREAGQLRGRLSLNLPDHPDVSLVAEVLASGTDQPALAVAWNDDVIVEADGSLSVPADQTTVSGNLLVTDAEPGAVVDAWRGRMRCTGGDLLSWQPAGDTEVVPMAAGVPLQILPRQPLTVTTDGTVVLASFTVSLPAEGSVTLAVDGGADGDWPQLLNREDSARWPLVPEGRDHALCRLARQAAPETPAATRLGAVYPNPFNPTVNIPYDVASAMHVRLAVFDVTGRRVAVICDGHHAAGAYLGAWHGRDSAGKQVASGTYYLRFDAGGTSQLSKMTMLK